ncbi:MAG: hypothetical protein WCG85_24790, partial [Polyangia bacterium]
EGRWRDAEEFLAFVDAAHRNDAGLGKDILRLMFDRMSSSGSISFSTTGSECGSPFDRAMAQPRELVRPRGHAEDPKRARVR